jgi:glycosyltransferase involved in cell wall biosynthesis
MNPRVVVLTTYFRPIIGGVESNAERLARYLHAHGFGVRVVTKRIGATLADRETLDGVPVERIGPYGERSASGKWRLLPSLYRWLVRHRADYDVACCVDYRGVGVAAVAARARTGRPVVLQAQTPGNLLETSWAARAVIGIYRRADAFACISHVLEREALAAGVPPAHVHFIPNPVDMSRFRPAADGKRQALRSGLAVPAGATVCLFVGRLSREKGVMDLMNAWNEVRPANAVLLVAGPDMTNHPWNEGPAARAFVDRHGLGTSVRFLGPIADVAPLLQAADVVIQPSHFEALGLSAVEALAAGVPVIASAVGGLLDFIADGHNGTLCPPRNPGALAAAVRTLLADEAFRLRLSARARDSVADEYDEQKVFARFGDLLRRVAFSSVRPA